MRARWVLCATLLTAPLFAEPWSSAGPYGGPITAFAAASSRVVYAGSAGGVFKSGDGGWTRAVNGLASFAVCVNELSLDPAAPSHLFLGAIFDNWQSFNGGAMWQRTSSALPTRRVVAHPQIVLTRYGIENANRPSFLVSKDGGLTWAATAPFGLPVALFGDLAIDPATARLFLGTALGTFRSGDGGEN